MANIKNTARHLPFISGGPVFFIKKKMEEADRFCLQEIITRQVLFWPAQLGFIFSFF